MADMTVRGVNISRATDGMAGWHVEWWEGRCGPYMVIGCTEQSARALLRRLRAIPEAHIIGAYEIGRRDETEVRG